MDLIDIVVQVRALLQQQGRLSYRIVQRQFALDEAALEDVKFELIDIQEVAIDKDGKMLVWTGEEPRARSQEQGVKSEEDGVKTQQGIDTPRAEAERRQLTVMFCDLVGSTALSTQLDPEELRDVVRAYQQTSATVIERFGGHIAQYLGDGLLVYFGYPAAHEDDAARAVRAGLRIIEAVHALNMRFIRPLQVRIGIHTGPVVVGEMGGGSRQEQLALGETPNLAARIQGQAAPDEVVISAATYRLIEGLFACEDRGSPELKGVAAPLLLYRVVKEEEAQSRFQVVARKGLTPLVGREHEFGLLRERWERVKDGLGQIVLLSGEPGIGKSRLVEALKETVEHGGARCLELRCSPYHQNSALYPIIDHLQRRLQFDPEETPNAKLGKLQRALSSYRFPQADTWPLFATLLSLPHPEGYPPLTLSPQKQKEKTHEALVAWLCEEAKQQAMTYAWEDLHWADPSTLELLTSFLQQVPTTRILAVMTFRPEFTSPWGSHSYLSQLTLSRLGRSQVEVMVERVTDGKALPKEVVQQITSKTDGVPLFVEELTKMVVESDLVTEVDGHYELSGPLPPLAIPSTLQDSLMARLDRLTTVRGIAQMGATIGREFNYDLLQAVSLLNEEALQQGLRQLVEAELVFQSGVPPQARYLFKHALIQDTAYQSLLKSTRQRYHHRIAQLLEARFPEAIETQPELVAHHYTEAGLHELALPYWRQAGERAAQRSAYVEAVTHLTKGLEALKTLPDTPERAQQELAVQLALSITLSVLKGYTAPEVQRTILRAQELSQQLPETPQLFPVLYRLWTFYFLGREMRTARELAEQMMRLAQNVQDTALLSQAHTALGWTLYDLGEPGPARLHAEQGIVLYDPEQHPRSRAGAIDLRVNCLTYATWALWLLGYPDQARKRSQETLVLAEGLSHPFSLAYALGSAALLHSFRREEQCARERAEAVVKLATEHGFPFWVAFGTMVQGWALAEQGQVQEGIARMRRHLQAPVTFALLAKAYGAIGQVEDGLAVLAEALAFVDRTGARVSEAEVYRLKGELTRQQVSVVSCQLPEKSGVGAAPLTGEEEAETYFLKAIEIARNQQAKSLELRAAVSLTRLWQRQGKQKEAHHLLTEIYFWFTEGFDTKDLLEAKVLLEELGESC